MKMPFAKAKSRNSQAKFKQQNNNPAPQQDEFLNYYRQYRNPSTMPYYESPPWSRYQLNREVINSSAESDYDFGSCYSNLPTHRGPSCGLFSPSTQFPPSQRSQPVSPSDLSGMLAEKMSFASRPRMGIIGDDQQSRDSGHITGSSAATNSSSESPRYRYDESVMGKFNGDFRRRPPPPKQMSLDSAEKHYKDHTRRHMDWQPYGMNLAEDRDSVYSYNTAMDSGVDSVVSYMDYNPMRNSLYSRTGSGRDAISLHSSQTRPLFEDLVDNDDELSESASWSPWMGNSPPSLRHRIVDQQNFKDSRVMPPAIPEKPKVPESPPPPPKVDEKTTFQEICLAFWRILKFSLSASCCVLVCLALFVASRSISCRWNSHQEIELSTLEAVLKANLIGQQLAVKELVQALGQFYNRSPDSGSTVLVLYLLGWFGTGKTLTSTLLKSQFPITSNVHVFNVPVHFAPGVNFNILDDLAELIRRSCGYSLVIFEDVESETISPSVSGHLARFILKLEDRRSPSSNGTIVVITSNAGGQSINRMLLNSASSNLDKAQLLEHRDRVTIGEVVSVIDTSEIPMYETLSASAVSYNIVPFLPLSRDHVRQCIVRQLTVAGVSVSALEVNTILDDLSFFSENFPIFSKTGCKKVGSKVDLLLGNKHTFLGLG